MAVFVVDASVALAWCFDDEAGPSSLHSRHPPLATRHFLMTTACGVALKLRAEKKPHFDREVALA
jgi:hypothetical protein